jgi:hypothetical protein
LANESGLTGIFISESLNSVIFRGQALLGLAQKSLPVLRVWYGESDVCFNDYAKSLKQIACLEKHFGCSIMNSLALNFGFFSHDQRNIRLVKKLLQSLHKNCGFLPLSNHLISFNHDHCLNAIKL